MADFETLARKKREIDAAGPLPAALVRNLLDWYEVELTYTSNAIEGNTLTRQETALVLEKGIAIGGKPLKDHLEAVNHRDALRLVYALAEPGAGAVTERTVLDLHAIVLRGLDPAQAGRYRTVPVRLRGSRRRSCRTTPRCRP